MLEPFSNGDLRIYSSKVISTNILDKWIHVNIVHTVATREIKVYVDYVLVYTTTDNGASSFYFKTGVYNQDAPADLSELYVKNIHIYSK